VIPVCNRCESDITSSNHRHAGYCSPGCRDDYRLALEQERQRQQERRAARRPAVTYRASQ
jgi:hypothetical protein